MTIFILILTFYAPGMGTVAASSVPATYTTLEACNTAGDAAKTNYNGGSHVEWTCVPEVSK